MYVVGEITLMVRKCYADAVLEELENNGLCAHQQPDRQQPDFTLVTFPVGQHEPDVIAQLMQVLADLAC